MNSFEHSVINNGVLPNNWKDKSSLLDLETFLQDNWNLRSLLFSDGEGKSKQKFLSFLSDGRIRTNNYIGSILYKGEQLNIFPKVYRKNSLDNDCESLDYKHLIKNIIKWISYCNSLPYHYINFVGDFDDSEDLKELFVSLFILILNNAINKKLFYKYVEDTSDLSYIRGKFDVKDYVINKIPTRQSHMFRSVYSDFVFDNEVNQIIKYTCRNLCNNATAKNQKKLYAILSRFSNVSDVVITPHDCDKLRIDNTNNDYRIIIGFCKMFLINNVTNNNSNNQNTFCFLFPTEYLFEGYVGGFIKKEMNNYNAMTYLSKSNMHLFDELICGTKNYGPQFKMIHDILIEKENKSIVLDTKYKMVDRFYPDLFNLTVLLEENIIQSDLYQICEYARRRKTKKAYLVYPMFRCEDNIDACPFLNSDDITIYLLRVPFIHEGDSSSEMLFKEIIKYIYESSF